MTVFTEREFRDALGQFATGIVVVTADVDGQLLGSTMSSFNAVSLTPPLVLFSIARSAQGFLAWQNARNYGIIVLGESQSALSNRFARGGTDKWQDLTISRMGNGAPLLQDWTAHFECTPYARHDGGDHEIFVAWVDRFEISRTAPSPLVFFKGKYRSLAEDSLTTPPSLDDAWLHGW
jgi:flavin reductase (DIM6/NTAB) family NADH-FMN oxidoreductase RutF